MGKEKEEFKSEIFDNSKLIEVSDYSKVDAIKDIKSQKASSVPKLVSIFRSKGLLGFILWTFISFKMFGYKNSTLTTPPSLSIGIPINGVTVHLNPFQSLMLTLGLLALYLAGWYMFVKEKEEENKKRLNLNQ